MSVTGNDPDLGDDEPIAAINIVPLVDVILVVLVIFLLTSSMIARAGLDVHLPKAANAAPVQGETVALVLTEAGDVLVDGAPVPLAQLTAALSARRAERAVISADKSSRYELVIAMIDAAKAAGIAGFALHVEWTR